MSVNTASSYSVLRVAIEHAASHPLAAPAALTQADLHAAPDLTDAGRRAARVPVLRCRPRAALAFQRMPDRRDHRAPARCAAWIAAPHLVRGDLVALRLASRPLQRPWRIAWRRGSRR